MKIQNDHPSSPLNWNVNYEFDDEWWSFSKGSLTNGHLNPGESNLLFVEINRNGLEKGEYWSGFSIEAHGVNYWFEQQIALAMEVGDSLKLSGPSITNINTHTGNDLKKIILTFDKFIEPYLAKQRSNYTITPYLQIKGIEVIYDNIILYTQNHAYDAIYSLKINILSDFRENHSYNLYRDYQFYPCCAGPQVNPVNNHGSYMWDNIVPGKLTYVKNDQYKIDELPPQYKGSAFLRTSLEDANNEFLELNFEISCDSSKILLAILSDIIDFPTWIHDDYRKIKDSLIVKTENDSCTFNLYESREYHFKGDIVHLYANPSVENNSLMYFPITTQFATRENSPPSVDDLLIYPQFPLTKDSLSASYRYFDIDGDREQNSNLSWYCDDQFITHTSSSHIIFPEHTRKHQIWYFEIEPFDGYSFGTPQVSESVTILNSPPVIDSIEIEPQNPSDRDTLKINYQYLDADNDSEGDTEIRWFNNEVHDPDFDNQRMISPEFIAEGDEWYCLIEPHDGETFGSTYQSDHVVISASNHPPIIRSGYIVPRHPHTKDILKPVYDFFDDDGDLEIGSRIIWYVKRNIWQEYRDIREIPADLTMKGDMWYYSLQPGDGNTLGNIFVSDTVTVFNTLPTITDLHISPPSPEESDSLTLVYTFKDNDNDCDCSSTIFWYRNDKRMKMLENRSVVPSSITNSGEKWYCEIIPFDGENFGSIARSDTVVINVSSAVSPLCAHSNHAHTIHVTNYPNPFNMETTIYMYVPERTQINAKIINLRGQIVCELFSETINSGEFIFRWNGTDDSGNYLNSGIYFCTIRAKFSHQLHYHSRKLILLK